MNTRLPLSLLLLALVACGDDDPETLTRVTGVTTADPGYTVPETTGARILWVVSSGSPDYELLSASGTASPTGFEIDLEDPIPERALNTYDDFRLGVGVVVAAEAGQTLITGEIETDEQWEAIGAGSPRHAIIYVDGTVPDDFEADSWVRDFPAGYSCGEGVAAAEGETFESFRPIDCSEVVLRFGDVDDFDWVNWT